MNWTILTASSAMVEFYSRPSKTVFARCVGYRLMMNVDTNLARWPSFKWSPDMAREITNQELIMAAAYTAKRASQWAGDTAGVLGVGSYAWNAPAHPETIARFQRDIIDPLTRLTEQVAVPTIIHAMAKCDHNFCGPEVVIENGSSRSCCKCGMLAITDAIRS